MSFAVSSITERLTDSSPLVVMEVLLLDDTLPKILPKERQFSLLLKALDNYQSGNYFEWIPVSVT